MQAALTSRAIIDQAVGVLMAAYRCSPAQAVHRLRETSQQRNVALRAVAEETVQATQTPDQPAGSPRESTQPLLRS